MLGSQIRAPCIVLLKFHWSFASIPAILLFTGASCLMSQKSDVCCTTWCMTSKSMYSGWNWFILFKTCIITHNNNVIEQNINVSMFDILSVKKPHRSLSILNRALKQTTLKAHYGSRKGTIQKYFANPKKYSESLSFRQIAFEKVVKSRKQFQILV